MRPREDDVTSPRFHRPSPTLPSNGYATPTAGIPGNQIAAAASQLQLVVDELLGGAPEQPTSFAFRSQEGVQLTGEWRDGAWDIRMELAAYGQSGTGVQLSSEELSTLIELLRSAAEKA